MKKSGMALERLAQVLGALPQANMPMTVSELDGYVIGLLVCPDMIVPSEWLPRVWGEAGEVEFPDMRTAEATISAVMEHYNARAKQLSRPGPVEPIYELDANSGETMWEPWVDGFTRAVRLRPKAWQQVLDSVDEDVRSALMFLLALQEVYEDTSRFSDAEVDEIDASAPDIIPTCIARIMTATRPQASARADNMNRPITTAKPPGRNDPCPCGSGRKYKKCCGTG